MRGSVSWQCQEIMKEIDCIGESKHAAKEAAREAGAETWHEMGKELGVYSYGTMDAYLATWASAFQFAKAEEGIKDITKLTPEVISNYLESRINDEIAHATFMKEAAALEKLEVALNSYAENHGTGKSYEFSSAIDSKREVAHGELERFEGSRAYSDPGALVNAVSDYEHKLAASIQHEGGSRIHETSLIKENQLKGERSDKVTGEIKGYIEVQGKGGKRYEVGVSLDTYSQLVAHIADKGEFRIDKDDYRSDLKAAAGTTGQDYTGSHGLRWSFAQERFKESMKNSHTAEMALKQVSSEMGHQRADITEHYLR